MTLSHKQKEYLKLHLKQESVENIASSLQVPQQEIIHYLQKKWSSEKFNRFMKNRANKSEQSNSVSLNPLINFNFFDFIKNNWKYLALLTLITSLTYVNMLNNALVSDDIAAIAKNPDLKYLSHVFVDPKNFLRGLLSWVAYQLGGTNPFFYHLINLLFHIGSVILVFILIRVMHGLLLAILTSLIFAVHPINSEAVTWISGGGYSQYTFFFLISFLFYIIPKKTVKNYLVSLGAFLLCLESMVTAPVLILIFILYEFSIGNIKKNWRQLMPYILLAILWGLAAFVLLPSRISTLHNDYNLQKGYDNPLQQIPTAIASYLLLFVWPHNLTLYHSELSFSLLQYLIYVVIFLAFTGLAIYGYLKKRFIFFWISFFFISLLPTLTPLRISWVVAERYVYLGSIGLCILSSYLFLKIVKNSQYQKACYILFAIIITALSVRTIIRNADWKTEDSLWIATGITSPSSPNTHNNLGDVYTRAGDKQAALAEFKKAVEIKPDYADAYHNLANTYQMLGTTDEAIKNYQLALHYNPNIWQSYSNLAVIYYDKKDYRQAMENIQKALSINPNEPKLQAILGMITLQNGNSREAENIFSKVLQLDPENNIAKQGMQQLHK